MKRRFGNTGLIAAAGLALLAGSALAQSTDQGQTGTRSISVVGTDDAAKALAGTPSAKDQPKATEVTKDTPGSDAAAKALPPIPTELVNPAESTKDKALATPAAAADAKTAVSVVPAATPDTGKGKPETEGGKDNAALVPPPNPGPAAKPLARPKTAEIEVPPSKSHQRHYDQYDHFGRSGEYGHRRYDHCEHASY